jgi:Domain of unknown function (DUF932)
MTRETLFNIPVPESTKSYQAVPNRLVIETTLDLLEKNNFHVVKEDYRLGKTKNVAQGKFVIEGENKDFQRTIEFINSYDKSKALGFVSGLYTFICQNGAFSGEYSFKKKHVGDINRQLQHNIQSQIEQIDLQYNEMLNWFEEVKLVPMSTREMSQLAGQMFVEESLFRTPQLNQLKKEIINPTFDYGGNNNTLYEYFQHCTCALKESNIIESNRQHVKVFDFLKLQAV